MVRVSLLRAAPTALLLVLALAGRAAALSDAPLSLGTPGTFRALFLEMPLADARGAGAGRLEVRWWMANDWSTPTRLVRGSHVVLIQDDAQADVLQLAATAPWSRFTTAPFAARVESTAELRLTERWGGWSDTPIEKWHGLIGSTNFQRQLYRRDAVRLRLAEEGGTELVGVNHPQAALGDLALRTQVRLGEGTAAAGEPPPWAVALRADLKLPTGRLGALGGSGGVDAGLGLAATWAPATWSTVHALAAVRLDSPLPHHFPLQPETVQWNADLSWVVRVAGRVALVLEDRLCSALFRGGWAIAPATAEPQPSAYYALFRPHNQISGGVRVDQLTVFFSEDFTPGHRVAGDTGPRWFYDSNEPDVVLGAAWTEGW